MALEQNAKEVGFLTYIFEDQPSFRFQVGSLRLLRQSLDVGHQFRQPFIQHFHQQLIKALVMPVERDVGYLGAFCDLPDRDGGKVFFQNQ